MGQSYQPPPWLIISTPFIILILSGCGLWLVIRRKDEIIEDSDEFIKALDIWHPLIAFRRKTPRELKRFQNQVRYLAMRFYPEGKNESKGIMTDDILVSLFTLYDCEPEIICNNNIWKQIKEFFNHRNYDIPEFISEITQLLEAKGTDSSSKGDILSGSNRISKIPDKKQEYIQYIYRS